jgi:hypothetical protein
MDDKHLINSLNMVRRGRRNPYVQSCLAVVAEARGLYVDYVALVPAEVSWAIDKLTLALAQHDPGLRDVPEFRELFDWLRDTKSRQRGQES